MSERPAVRLYITDPLAPGAVVRLAGSQAHYLRVVLRRGPGAAVAAFNAADGEWLCHIAEIGRGGVRLTVERRMRSPTPEPDLWLLFAPALMAQLHGLPPTATSLGPGGRVVSPLPPTATSIGPATSGRCRSSWG